MEKGIIILPEHLVNGMGLNRDHCDVIIQRQDQGNSEIVRLQCSPQNIKTIHGCRSDYKLGEFQISGCPLRNNISQNVRLLSENIGIELEK